MKFFDYKNEVGIGILVSVIIVIVMSAIMIPAFLLENKRNSTPSTSQMASVVFNSYKVENNEKTSISNTSEFNFMADDEPTESFTSPINAQIDSNSHVLVTYEVRNKSQDKNLECILDLSKLTITNCKVSYSTNNRTFYEFTENTKTFTLLPAGTKTISVKIEIIDSALNSLLTGDLSLILSLV